ncbi:hypothetical protein A3H10_01785 [Candidatus Uhrbacteria bacterium RIFCSPLOWO2_12_FULL_46_10]|uniref:Type II secretion system protein GspG C-terminal domain-containing protein n=1 Tax=Candidatus Uhrbacteria bacterium RIFCSPLOWO2_01_FULL_47_25 TaxID=1802402 RepID=A0A1F7UT16_9BACT|nr:MAG: hypothetical protein A2752_03345 [Candidatus Uhrbacteria bacterium RIFCSPHIGHO2_01_FULL_46_23]OGL69540.1 MAG: hypothetical protein A3D60_00870 [Candidatus Uhrbacteria bacterium RIFCSPHIGHO2_02_FULL_47_29]OGL76002.1 MAG: hypothetical protein A3E96_02090 [Candidatus Uhrbacteria bacterium RIFCSPHIGHO2_12_FULL_46_13]OGL81399.1 MAG: hypothetical protein A2936_00190 [Candidatus Uhrbacteria bacterium RIFCSPLOWO2_01_FULL_47_25]OGL86108.1 MAG: hypothetical protein A3I37_00060 [Candidatus Uhrbact
MKGGENMIKRKGFTLIELLVVIGIIALLSTLAVVALNNARAKARDGKRVADIKQMQTALELYYANRNQNAYPISTAAGTAALVLGDTSTAVNSSCLDDDGWSGSGTSTAGGAANCYGTIYMGQVPSNPTPTAGTAYTYVSDASGATYTMTFGLEGVTGSLNAGGHTATPAGIQ